MASSSDKKKEEKVKIGALLKLQNTNGSFELTENFCKTIGLPYAAINKQKQDKQWDGKAWATALAIEFIDAKCQNVKPDFIKEFDKSKLFLFKVWADSQPFLKEAAMAQFTGSVSRKGLDGDGRPIVI